MDMTFFLTAFDPSDLPGSSVDPLGFDRSYSALANLLLPGLTNVASRPRCFAVLCAGSGIADVVATDTPRALLAERSEAVMRLERLWALGHALLQADEEDGLDSQGIRGIRYAQAHAARLRERGAVETNLDFKLLARQMPNGIIGTYGFISDGLRLLDRDTLHLTPDLGARLGEAFCKETKIHPSVKEAAVHGGKVPLRQLQEWAKRAHVSGDVEKNEAECYGEILDNHPVRARFSKLLAAHPRAPAEPELFRLSRIRKTIAKSEDTDIVEAIDAVVAFEDCYRTCVLAFERLLWMSRGVQAGGVKASELEADAVLHGAHDIVPKLVARFSNVVDHCTSTSFLSARARLLDARAFLERAARSASTEELVDVLVQQHKDVQHGKLQRGKPKSAWLVKNDGVLSLTMGRAGGLGIEAQTTDDIRPHMYRTHAADALVAAAGRS